MESIKETELNLQREVVTTVPNTWLVEAVNPSTGEKKMIDIANYASVVAGQMKDASSSNRGLMSISQYNSSILQILISGFTYRLMNLKQYVNAAMELFGRTPSNEIVHLYLVTSGTTTSAYLKKGVLHTASSLNYRFFNDNDYVYATLPVNCTLSAVFIGATSASAYQKGIQQVDIDESTLTKIELMD